MSQSTKSSSNAIKSNAYKLQLPKPTIDPSWFPRSEALLTEMPEYGVGMVMDEGEMETPVKSLKERKLRHVDSLNVEAGKVLKTTSHTTKMGWIGTLSLSFQCLGVVYGDLGTSPLYVLTSTFSNGISHKDDLLGVLSLIYYTILLIPLLKYVFIVLRANDNGNGGAFALYSLMCRHAKVSLIPNQQPEDMELSNYKLQTPSNKLRSAQKLKQILENSHFAKLLLLNITIFGTTMIIGDGIFTPAISVLSAVSGISTSLSQDVVVEITIVILVILFAAQRFGTDRVGFTFAPILSVWFLLVGGTGIYNVFKHDIGVLRAVNPMYIFEYFQRTGKQGWVSLGGVFLCISGCEAMFADLGHFSVRAIQISFSFVTFPAVLAAYSGQAAYLRKFPGDVSNAFYASVPHHLYWPTFVVAVLASIIASQAIISGAFSIVSQAQSMGCFPNVKVVHTSTKHEGQVYIPEINYMLMIGCIVVTAAFRTSEQLSNAYGIAINCDTIITTFLVSVVMLVVWKKSISLVALFYLPFTFIEFVYLSSQLTKFTKGGYFPLVIAVVMTMVMGTWQYVQKGRYMFELKNKVPTEYLRKLANDPNINRVPGIGLLYSELVQGIPPIFPHFIANVPCVHSVVVFVTIKAIPISSVAIEERFLFQQVEQKEYRIFRCVVRHGYNDVLGDVVEFESQLVQQLKEFIRQEDLLLEVQETTTTATEQVPTPTSESEIEEITDQDALARPPSFSDCIQSLGVAKGVENEINFIEQAMEKGVVHLLGETEVVADSTSSIFNKIIVNYAYNFLRKNFRQKDQLVAIHGKRLLKVGMTYEI